MRKIKTLLRLKYEQKLPHRTIAKSLNISPSTVYRVTNDAKSRGITWPIDDSLTDDDIYINIYGQKNINRKKVRKLNFEHIHKELKRKHVTKMLLWEEYSSENIETSYSYSQFCHMYRSWKKDNNITMRQIHKAGEKLYVDYAGQTVNIFDTETGKSFKAYIFVATLGASNYTFALATKSQNIKDWVESHVHAFNFFGGVPEMVVPDNLKSAVIRSDRYDPDLTAPINL